MDASTEWEHKIFRTRDPNAEIELRAGFGWRLQSHSASDFATGGTFAGVSYAPGDAGAFAGGMKLRTDHWVNLQMMRSRTIPGHAELVRCEEEYLSLVHPRQPFSVSRFIASTFFLWIIGLLVLLSFVSPLNDRVEAVTAGWGEGSLTIAALVSLPLVVGFGLLAALPFRARDSRRLQEWQLTVNGIEARRTRLWKRAQQLLGEA